MTFNDAAFANANTKVTEMKGELEDSIGDLRTAAMGYADYWVSQFGFERTADWSVGRGREVTLSDLGDLPVDRPVLNIPAFTYNPEDYLGSDLLGRYSYDSDFFDNFLDSRLRDFIDTESAFIAQDVQDALFQQTRERDLQVLNDALDAVDRREARKGFPIPMSLMEAARGEVIKRYQDTRSDRNKEITALIAERAHDGRKHAIDAGLKMEDIRSKFQLEFGRLYWQAADYLIRKYEADVRAEIARFSSELDLMKADTDTKLKMADFDLNYEKLDQDKEKARIDAQVSGMKTDFEAWAQTYKGRIEAAATASGYYSAAVSAFLSQINAINYEDTSA